MAVSPVVKDSLRRAFKRCVICPPTAPTCPSCPGTTECVLVPQSCDTCAHMKCIDNPIAPPPSQGPNVGAIAGGVAGGVGFVVLVVFLIWFFWIKKRRELQDRQLREEFEQDEIAYHKRSTRLTSFHDGASTRTRGSLANSILSRASNFIQIAYIPGVTNRNGSGRNSILTPVPPIPAAHRQGANKPTSPLSGDGDALFFGIDDLRGSTYSGASSIRDPRRNSNRDTRYTMQSITPSLARESIASDVYWDDATAAPMPATTAARLAPRMVSVKTASSTPSTPGSDSAQGTPPEHMSDRVREIPVLIPGQSSSPASSVRGKATQVTLGGSKSKGRFPVRQGSDGTSGTSTPTSPPRHVPLIPSPLASIEPSTTTVEPESEHSRLRDSLLHNIDFATPPADPQPLESPFFDATDLPHASPNAGSSNRPNPYASMASTVGVGTRGMDRSYSPRRGGSKGKIGGLSAVMEEATKRASAAESAQGEEAAGAGAEGPFGDENRIAD